MGKLLLSICIPTYERQEYLSQNLEILLPQVVKYKEEIEVIVSDNASSQNPQELLFTLSKKYELILKFYRQEKNIGSEDNFNFLLSKANGEYVFLLGDDDLLSLDFLKILMPTIKKKKYSLIHWNRLCGDSKCSNSSLHDKKYLDLEYDCSTNDFILTYLSSPNFISSLIFLRELWFLGEGDAKSCYYGYMYLSKIYFGALKKKMQCYYYYLPLVIQRNPHRVWHKEVALYCIIGLSNIFRDIDVLIPGIYKKWIERMHDPDFYNFDYNLMRVSQYRNFYRKRIPEFKNCLTKEELVLLYIWLYVPFVGIVKHIYNVLHSFHNYLKDKV